ncbi:GTPase RsgA [Alistipes putredinis]|uniref:GTPase RsgA n=1 Tax=Alistipes putredinis TaxID=28117 RepID=UPI003AEF6460
MRELRKGHTALLAGNAGVGKSTLAGTGEPGLDIRTGDISESVSYMIRTVQIYI